MDIYELAMWVGEIIDLFGVIVIFFGVVLSTIFFVSDYLSGKRDKIIKEYRQNLGNTILVGLEILVAGDILRTIVGKPDWESIWMLAVIVLIRTFLSITFDMEINGRWPWQKKD